MTNSDDKSNSKPEKDEDSVLWRLYTQDMERLNPEKPENLKQENSDKPLKKQKISVQTAYATPETAPEEMPAQIDRRTATRLKRGQMPIDARIDLHGLYQKDAKARLSGFIEQSYHSGFRCVLVITGKGKLVFEGEGVDDRTPGVIRRNFHDWMSEPLIKNMVLKIEAAQVKDGGAGAFYVLLRKKR